MGRLTRNTFILALVESPYGTDSTPTGANAMLASKPSGEPDERGRRARATCSWATWARRSSSPARASWSAASTSNWSGSGAAGTRPAWGDLMLACGWAETVTASTRVDYTLVSTAFQSVSLYWHDDGVRHKFLGTRGNVGIKLNAEGIPVLSFSFKGLYATVTATANPTPTLTGFKVPQVVNDQNTADFTVGGTHATVVAPAIVGGLTYPSQGIEFDLGNTVEHIPLLTGETIEITQRSASCKFNLDLTAAQEVTFQGYVENTTMNTIGIVHGTSAGYKSLLWLPSVQVINPSKVDVKGKRLLGYEGRCVPTSGNDEARLVLF
jgi:hypothetical protein